MVEIESKVWHCGLLINLRQLELSGNMLQWFASYLNNRIQQVVVDGSTSQPVHTCTRNALVHSTVKLWNNLSVDVRSVDSFPCFKKKD